MRTETRLLVQGALAAFADGEMRTDIQNAGVTPEEFEMFRGDDRWRWDNVAKMLRTLERVMAVAIGGGVARRVPMTAEYAASAIATFVQPGNWLLAADGLGAQLDGVQLVSPEGDDGWRREHISTERMLALILMSHGMAGFSADARSAKVETRMKAAKAEAAEQQQKGK